MIRRSLLAVGLLAVVWFAGCAQTEAPLPEAARPADTDLASFLECPQWPNGTLIKCVRPANEELTAAAETAPIQDWTCLTWADERMATAGNVFPPWYTYYGQTPAGPEQYVRPLTWQVGIQYDARNFTGGRVAGIIQVVSEDEDIFYHWEGPAAAFARLPVEITEPNLFLRGVIFPAEARLTSEEPDARGDYVVDLQGFDVEKVSPFWFVGPMRPEADPPSEGDDWDTLRAITDVAVPSKTYHFAMEQPSHASDDPRNYPGAAHWGWHRDSVPLQANHSEGNKSIRAQLLPFLYFYAEFRDVNDAAARASAAYLCACPTQLEISVKQAMCLAGITPLVPEVAPRQVTTVFQDLGGGGRGEGFAAHASVAQTT